ncbi:hypothetical protein [uncultured Alistipes sp.]|uniref:hypothetical protein n=1 Tax=uncultured Alistipes sp. TaxID=538949 RepID=UPI0026043E8B|nr:hypothetical protein [uncultured Alistipes sp.]
MESLLVLILSVVVSGILAAQQKKKASRNIPHPDEHTAPPSSPWDDLMRELRNGTERTEHSSPAVESAEEEFLENRMPLPEGQRAPFDGGASERSDEEPAPYFTYDDQTLAEWSAASEPAPAAPLSKRDTTTSPQAAPSVPEHTEHNESPFAEGFDPRMGVLYAEIMTPKFRQY